MKALFVGLGYIGLPTATLVANNGLDVIGVDLNSELVNNINSGKFQTSEHKLQDMIQRVVKNGSLKAQTEPEEADVFFIVVPTPIKDNREPDISIVEAAIKSIIPYLKKDNLIIIESTISQSTTEQMAELVFNSRPDLKDLLHIAYCPERVLPGNILFELENNDRVVGGIDSNSSEMAKSFYSKFIRGKIYKTDSKTAELCKLTENAYRDVQIAFANELSVIAHDSGVDVLELISLANKHPRVNILNPGCGVGGHCIAVDPWFLIHDFPENTKLIGQARKVNIEKTEWCLRRIYEQIRIFIETHKRSPTISCMGLAYKPDSDDMRESPARHIAIELIKNSDCEVIGCEPNINTDEELVLQNADDAYNKADIILWLVAHKEFFKINQDNTRLELDFCGLRSNYN